MDNKPTRLNKFLALSLGISRRQADELINKNKVLVNNIPAKLGQRINKKDKVVVNEKPVKEQKFIYYLLNKPVGYVSSRKQQGDRPTIYDLLPEGSLKDNLKPVGRLDQNSEGLMLLTNDGDFAYKMTHPSFQKNKEYEVFIDKPLEPLHQQMINDFKITLEDGKSNLLIERLDDSRKFWKVTMSEGKKRQIRRTFLALGYKVLTLKRTVFGPYSLEELKGKRLIKTIKK